jgi:hypothetical protein
VIRLFEILSELLRTSGISTIPTQFRASAHWRLRKVVLMFWLKSPAGYGLVHRMM